MQESRHSKFPEEHLYTKLNQMNVGLKHVRKLSTKVEIDGQETIIPVVCLGRHSVSDSLLCSSIYIPCPSLRRLHIGLGHFNCRTSHFPSILAIRPTPKRRKL
jgi:hypothetical protein